MHFVTAYQWASDGLKPIQLECPDPPAIFDDFLRYNGFRNNGTFPLGESASTDFGDLANNISIRVYQADLETASDFGQGPRFLARLGIADINMLILLESPCEYISFLNAYSPLLTLGLLYSIQKELGKLGKDLTKVEAPKFHTGGA